MGQKSGPMKEPAEWSADNPAFSRYESRPGARLSCLVAGRNQCAPGCCAERGSPEVMLLSPRVGVEAHRERMRTAALEDLAKRLGGARRRMAPRPSHSCRRKIGGEAGIIRRGC